MPDQHYIALTAAERDLIQYALAAVAEHKKAHLPEMRLLSDRLSRADDQYPDITVGVHGGLVQWVTGNPFPIRICDYDGDGRELPNIDVRGQRCSMWFEPASV